MLMTRILMVLVMRAFLQAAGGLRQSKDANIPPPVPRHAPPTAQSPGGE
jgi:hypothetical protein